ncbi:MAG TPA: PilX N-terminal domain-containing pilus assembly protein [Thermoanaerobaculia bacterium]|nr:PilX N-terminal domain-containing pilus assembly protein [Thermoanaerobaculia bacterium]
MMEKKSMRAKKQRSPERGAALIITVIVIMVLMTLGLAMVAFTTTEERTATTYRDGLQAREIAQAGVNLVAEMFRDPTDRQLVPLFNTDSATCTAGTADYCGTDEATTETSLNRLGIWRADRTPLAPARYTGINNRFFLGPFQDAWGQTFGGTHSASSDIYDLSFECRTVASPPCWLDSKFNSLLQASSDFNQDTGKITKINFYAPPTANGIQYGICTVRVTAIKTDSHGAVLARETLEAVIGDLTPRPAVLGNGDVILDVSGGTLCGDGCEAVHANGNITVGNVATGSGQNPVVTATGSVTGQGSPTGAGGKATIQSPKINPWDLAYKPTNATDLNNYYLVTARQLDLVWTDGNASNNPAPRQCGINNLSLCQDYNLEYDTSGNPKADRSATGTPYMYKWNPAANEWTQCASGTTLNTCAGAPSFSVTPQNDQPINVATGDDADIPFRKDRVPQTVFTLTNPINGSTVLIDGQFDKHASGSWQVSMAIISVGSQSYSSSTTWYPPSATNLIMWISGRDITSNANCCAPSNTCATNLANLAAQGIIAAHEQIYMHAQVALAGVIISENKVNWDPTVNSTTAINIDRGDHCYTCGRPDWPWTLPVTPAIISLKSVPE